MNFLQNGIVSINVSNNKHLNRNMFNMSNLHKVSTIKNMLLFVATKVSLLKTVGIYTNIWGSSWGIFNH